MIHFQHFQTAAVGLASFATNLSAELYSLTEFCTPTVSAVSGLGSLKKTLKTLIRNVENVENVDSRR